MERCSSGSSESRSVVRPFSHTHSISTRDLCLVPQSRHSSRSLSPSTWVLITLTDVSDRKRLEEERRLHAESKETHQRHSYDQQTLDLSIRAEEAEVGAVSFRPALLCVPPADLLL
jgi:hypothetical protein